MKDVMFIINNLLEVQFCQSQGIESEVEGGALLAIILLQSEHTWAQNRKATESLNCVNRTRFCVFYHRILFYLHNSEILHQYTRNRSTCAYLFSVLRKCHAWHLFYACISFAQAHEEKLDGLTEHISELGGEDSLAL